MTNRFGVLMCLQMLLVLVFSSSLQADKTAPIFFYGNQEFGFAASLQGDYEMKEIVWSQKKLGMDLKNKTGEITVQAMPTGTDYEKMPFEDYVRIAASAEIQNFQKLTRLERFTSDSGAEGYKTYWLVSETVSPLKKNPGQARTRNVGPIYYFPLLREMKVGRQPVKLVMIYFHPFTRDFRDLSRDAEKMARSFKYLSVGLDKKTFRSESAGRTISQKKNGTLRIELASNPSTGYQWFFDQLDPAYFQVIESGYRSNSKRVVGGGGTAWWEIKCLKAGESRVRLLYYRPWEGQKNTGRSFELKVKII
jgi:predicted secreted protein